MRLIDKTALGIGKCNPDVFEDKGYAKGWNAAIELMESAPIIDAVPVVRCRECVYWASGANEDESWEYCYWFESEIDGNEFCSYGERKDGADK